MHYRVLGAVQFTVTGGVSEACDNQKFLYAIYPTCYSTDTTVTNTTLLSISLNSTYAVEFIKQLQTSGAWLDDSSEKLDITIVTYNGELNAYGVTTLTLEFQEGGFIDLKSQSISANSAPYMNIRSFISDTLLLVCFVPVVGNQIIRLCKNRRGLGTHLKNFWNFVDYASTILIVTFYMLWALIVSTTRDSSFRTNVEAFSATNVDWTSENSVVENLYDIISSLMYVGHLTTGLRLIATVTILFLGIRILDSFSFHPRLNLLSHTISSSLHKFGSFLVVLAIVVVTFALSGHFIFGDRAHAFHTSKESLESCVNILFGIFDYSAIQGIIVPVSIIYYWSYLIVSNLILLNMMLAIVLDTYEEVSKEAYNDKTITPFGRIIYIVIYVVNFPELESRELSRREVIFRGRIRPDVLEVVFNTLKADSDKEQTNLVTPFKLQSLFFSAQVTDEEARKTIGYLLHGLLPLIDGVDDKTGEPTCQHRKLKHDEEGNSIEASATSATGGGEAWESFSNADVQQLSERMAALERKMELILLHVATES